LRASLDDWLQRFRAGERRAAARLISIVEDGGDEARDVLDALHPAIGRANRVGITGPPGAGKSTLVDRVATVLATDTLVGVVAVDPTSPFTGGALLGDRIRMGDALQQGRIFFRSLASRGSLGGLSLHTSEVVDVLDAFGCGTVLIETVGVGQSELDIVEKAHTTVVVLVPESGDSIQTMKAGLMEIADVFVVNKADRDGAQRLADEIAAALDLRFGRRPDPASWRPPVLLARARDNDGTPELIAALQRHRDWCATSGERRRKDRRALESRLRDLVHDAVQREVWSDAAATRLFAQGLQAIERGETTPYRVADSIVREWTKQPAGRERRA
jgi:LAO/AO transport system kinase